MPQSRPVGERSAPAALPGSAWLSGHPATPTRAGPGPTPQPGTDPGQACRAAGGNTAPLPWLGEGSTEDAKAGSAPDPAGPEDAAHGPDVWTLVRQAQEGDAEAFGRLYDRYVTVVYRYLHHRMADRAQAEDFTSETFVRALRRIDSLSFQGRDVGAWLVTIARNLIRDHVKSSRYRLEVSTADLRDADRATDGPEEAVLAELATEELLACVRRLGGEQQECISLRFLQGLSISETAAIMGKKDGAVKALQHRAVRRLAGLLREGQQ